MKILRQLLFAIIFIVGFSLATCAQNNDNREVPKKEKMPDVPVGRPKPSPTPPGNDSNNPKKPSVIKSADETQKQNELSKDELFLLSIP